MLDKKTNGEAYKNLSDEEKNDFRKMYMEHPLASYIDWEAYYNSTDGNALNFVICINKYEDEEGRLVFTLENLIIDDLDYKLIFVCEEETFYKVPDNDKEFKGVHLFPEVYLIETNEIALSERTKNSVVKGSLSIDYQKPLVIFTLESGDSFDLIPTAIVEEEYIIVSEEARQYVFSKETPFIVKKGMMN